MNIPFPWLVFDVESVGLFGDPFAVGWVIIDKDGKEIQSDWKGCSYRKVSGTKKDFEWCFLNIPKEVRMGNMNTTLQRKNDILDIYYHFGAILTIHGPRCSIISDCPFPVESKFLLNVEKYNSNFISPYPLYDVATALAVLGKDPTANYPRRANEPLHHPLGDARQSARILYETIKSS